MLIGLIASSLLAPAFAQTPPAPADERRSSLTGTIRAHPAFESKILGNRRDIWVYLPPNYDKEPKRRYPVLYMHDGQNVFDGRTSYLPKLEWRRAQGIFGGPMPSRRPPSRPCPIVQTRKSPG